VKSLPAVWRDAVRDSQLDRTAKLVALVLSTYFNARAVAWPSRGTLARGASVSDRAVDSALARLEHAGFLLIERTTGGRQITNRYLALLPETANELRRSEWERANGATQTAKRSALNSEHPSQESAESAESGALDAAAAFEGAAAGARGVCVGCGEEKRLALDGLCPICLREAA
jgi:hypothetical protein